MLVGAVHLHKMSEPIFFQDFFAKVGLSGIAELGRADFQQGTHEKHDNTLVF